MKLKLTNAQLCALVEVLKTVLDSKPPANQWHAKLLHTLLVSLYYQLAVKVIIKKERHSIKLKPEQAIAFFIYYAQHGLPTTNMAGNLINQIRNSIHQQLI